MAEIEMVIDSIRVSLMNYQRVVILKEKEAERYLPIWIGPAEADAIAVKMQGIAVARPLTHDFVCAVINTFGGDVKSAIISDLKNDCFYAKVVLKKDKEQIEIDCRPSDALAIALRVGAPIFANEKVLAEAGILLDPETGRPVGTGVTLDKEGEFVELPRVERDKLRKFSGSTQEIFALAEEEAKRLDSNYIGTGHLLLALVRKSPTMATMVLTNLGVNSDKVVSTVETAIDEEQPLETNKIALNLNAKKTIELCLDEARRLASPQVLPEHLLLGMMREEKGIAARLLKDLGINTERIYVELIRLYTQSWHEQ